MRKCAFYVLSTLRFCFLPGRGMLLLSHFPCVVPLQARTFHFNLQLKLEVQCKAQGEDFSSLYDLTDLSVIEDMTFYPALTNPQYSSVFAQKVSPTKIMHPSIIPVGGALPTPSTPSFH